MKPVVYIDVLFLLNFLIDFLLLFLTVYVCRGAVRLWRLILAAALGGLYSCLMFFPPLAPLWSAAGKLLAAAALVLLGMECRTLRAFWKGYAAFWMLTAVFGGCAFALVFFTGFGSAAGAVVSNGELYFPIGLKLLFPAVALACGGVAAFTAMCRKNFSRDRIILTLRLHRGGKNVRLRALIDTGCELCDPLDGRPVLLAWEERVAPLLTRTERHMLPQYRRAAEFGLPLPNPEWAEAGIRMLPFSSVGKAGGLLPAVRTDTIEERSGRYRLEPGCYLALLAEPVSAAGLYDAILNPDLLSERDITQTGGNRNVTEMSQFSSNKMVSVEAAPRTASPPEGTLYRGRGGAAAAADAGGRGGADRAPAGRGGGGAGASNSD